MIIVIAPNVFLFGDHRIALAPDSYTPLPGESDPNYQAVYDALEAQLLAVINEADNPPLPTLLELKLEKGMAAQAEQERHMGFGFRVTVGANEVILSSDAGQIEDIKLQVAELNAGIAWPASGIKMLARDGTEYQVTQPQFIAAFRAWRARVRALRDRYGELAQAIIAAAANEDDAVARAHLAEIDITAGWPAV